MTALRADAWGPEQASFTGSGTQAGLEDPIPQLLQNLGEGDREAMNSLIPLLYSELRRLADSYLSQERTGHTLQPTALVNEVYLRMAGQNGNRFSNRSHFLGVAARLMRQILVDHARRRRAAKRGNGGATVVLDEMLHGTPSAGADMVAVDDALEALEKWDARKARLVEMRFFGGLTADESAEALGIAVAQVRRDLRIAQAWLQREMDRGTLGN